MMRPLRPLLGSAVGLALAIGGCVTTSTEPPPMTSGAGSPSANTTKTTTTTTTTTTTHAPPTATPFALDVYVSSDEHGWLLPQKNREKTAWRGGVYAVQKTLRDASFTAGVDGGVLLSAGDMWTGPYESTVLEGAPLTAAMNLLGYQAAAVGNHEFDFGQRVLAERARGARFPLLGANLKDTATGAVPHWAKAWTVVDVTDQEGQPRRIGVLGLACVDSPITADVRNMVGLEFLPYDDALKAHMPALLAERPDAVIVVAHDSIRALKPLTPLLRQYGVHLIAAGHEHKPGIVVDDGATDAPGDDVIFCNSGPYWRTLCSVSLRYRQPGALAEHTASIVEVSAPLDAPVAPGDPALQKVVEDAEASATRIGGEVLVENKQPLTRGRDGSLGPLVVDAWLEALPYARVALTNAGGLRQDIEAGPLRLRDVVSALPFNNYLLVVDMSGKELKEALANPETVVGGLTYHYVDEGNGARVITDATFVDGSPVVDEASYKVIINDFMYRGGDHYSFSDREPEETAVDWREPIFRALRALGAAGKVVDRAPTARGTPAR